MITGMAGSIIQGGFTMDRVVFISLCQHWWLALGGSQSLFHEWSINAPKQEKGFPSPCPQFISSLHPQSYISKVERTDLVHSISIPDLIE